MKIKILVSLIALLSLLSGIVTASPLGTAFTYHGRLTDGASPANGSYDFRFAVYDTASGGTQQGSTVPADALSVADGLFITTLDFGPGVFTGDARWLEIRVGPHGSGTLTLLTPRQPLTPTPYAIFANTAGNLSGTLPASQLSGTVGNGQLANNSITVIAGTGLSGGGTAALGGSTTLNNTAVLSVAGNADITASTVDGAVTLGSSATSANTPSTIVKRDTGGNFLAGSVTLNGVLNLPTTTASAGIIYSGGNRLLHAYGTGNSFVGAGAGNFTMSGSDNTASGASALFNNTSGTRNTANGDFALYFNTSGSDNTAIGWQALVSNVVGSDNTANGRTALLANTSGNGNTAYGSEALFLNTTGSRNIALGYQAGLNITIGDNNIDIGNQGVAGEGNTIQRRRARNPDQHVRRRHLRGQSRECGSGGGQFVRATWLRGND